MSIATEPNTTERYMRQWVRKQTEMSDNPPRKFQFTINGKEIEFDDGDDITNYRIETPFISVNDPRFRARNIFERLG